MKKILLICLLALGTSLYAQDLKWAHGMGSTDWDVGYGVATDDAGNIYLTGSFQGTVDFDPGAGTASATAIGLEDIFILKFDADGNFGWVKTLGPSGNSARGNSIGLDAQGNIYVTGQFGGIMDFDPGAGTATHAAAGGNDGYVLKLDNNGDFVWAGMISATAACYGYDIAVTDNGYSYIVGNFGGTIDLDPGVGTQNVASTGGTDGFFIKLDDNGALVGGFTIEGGDDQDMEAVAVGPSNEIYMVGNFKATTDFNPMGTTNLTALGFGDIFILKLTPNGAFDWVKHIGSSMHESANDIVVDDNGNFYVTGQFRGTIDIDPGSDTLYLTATGWTDHFVQAFDNNGNLDWAVATGGDEETIGRAIAVNSNGEVITGGYFSGTADLDPGTGTLNHTAADAGDIFFQRLDQNGDLIEAYGYGGTGDDNIWDICVGPGDATVTTGHFSGTADFDPGAGTTTLTNNGWNDIFVQKFGGCEIDLSTTQFQSGPSYVVASNEMNGTGYQWLDCDNGYAPIAGEIGGTMVVTQNGNYACIVSVGTCSDTTDCITVSHFPTAVTDGFDIPLSLYPNPATETLRIRTDVRIESIEIRNMMGQSMLQTNSTTIPVGNLSPGMYMATIHTDQGVVIRRFIKD